MVSCLIYPQVRVASKRVKVGVVMQNWRGGAYCGGSDKTVYQPSHGLSALSAATIERGGSIIVSQLCLHYHRPRQQTSQAQQMRLIPRSRQYFHPHRVAHSYLFGQQFINEVADRASRIPQELYPSRGVDQYHCTRLERIALRSPSQPIPRRDRASSTEAGSVASIRNARLIASRLVASWYRRMTSAHA